ncbi:Hint domain-containing protein [Paracoccus aminophilus]|uniref:Hedgehog/Intein (Hint) domain-containing protein n=1 Tax=Paracoccus aminophilus JCM 7686 TaxID=1367847 RepID=S5YF56_PARAH|nr:Hint domain-containing protein [Paracoccus aminophilus]AGT10083.1 hypothetical protein JCM7686_3047 [Paracoccus aminophilus JCM 7686]
MATLQFYSIDSIGISRTDTGNSLSGGGNPLSNAQNGDAFSWQNPSNVAMTFTAPNAAVQFDDSDNILTHNPITNQQVTDQKLTGTNVIDGRSYQESPNTILWQNPPGSYVRAEYEVTLYDAQGHSYRMVGVSIVQGYTISPVGVVFLDGRPPSGTTLYYRQNGSAFSNNPSVPLNLLCFAAGTRIRTEAGEVAIEDLRPGMLVETLDNGAQPIVWIGSQRLDAGHLEKSPHLRAIRIRAGALGEGRPARDLVVSPQHRILVCSAIAQRMFGAQEVLVAAKELLMLPGIEIAEDLAELRYFHILLATHQILFAEGAEAESLFIGAQTHASFSAAARDEIAAIFPDLLAGEVEAVRPLLPGHLARRLTARHAKNGKPLNT